MSADELATFRILDANANRAAEGLRVVEEYLRFALDDRHLAEFCKQLRHDLQQALAKISLSRRYAARETQADVGTTIQTKSEYARPSVRDVAAASQKRVEQALRCLEEYSKYVCPEVGAAFEQIRYQTYTLSRATEVTVKSRRRLETANLYVLIDARTRQGDFAEFARALVASGVSIIQLREKSLTDRELLARARELREITSNTQTLFIMNDRPDLALLSRADGVHLGQDEMSIKDARSVVGLEALIGVSTHCIEQARRAVLDGANYIGCGPMFPSATKSFSTFSGTEFLAAIANEISLPAFAIGGITLQNVPQVCAAGIRRIAVQGEIAAAKEPAAIVQQLMRAIS
jgi:thiamine-phosphate pyrophosphorylase